jgi:hypothetical protein
VITLGNLRGIRESGVIFGLPTYFFIFAFGTMIVIGFAKVVLGDAPGSIVDAAEPAGDIPVLEGLSFFLILRAFSSGAAALTGVEAVSNGVQAFKPPESKNARATMQWEAALLGFLLIGVAFLATRYGLAPSHDETLVSQLGRDVLGENFAYYGYQVATAAVLFLAANTAYADFPRLGALLGRDKFAPHQLTFRGDRLAFSHGIILLGIVAGALLVIFDASVTRLIPLYVLGVFISMTLSQAGMVRHWLRHPEKGWRSSIAFNAVGATATGIVTIIVAASKFTHGAWISLLGMVVLVLIFTLIKRHYDRFADGARVPNGSAPSDSGRRRRAVRELDVIVPVEDVNRAALRAFDYARTISDSVSPVHVTDDLEQSETLKKAWAAHVPDEPLVVIESPYRSFIAPMLSYIDARDATNGRSDIAVVLPSLVASHFWERPLHNQSGQALRKALQRRPDTLLIEVPYSLEG